MGKVDCHLKFLRGIKGNSTIQIIISNVYPTPFLTKSPVVSPFKGVVFIKPICSSSNRGPHSHRQSMIMAPRSYFTNISKIQITQTWDLNNKSTVDIPVHGNRAMYCIMHLSNKPIHNIYLKHNPDNQIFTKTQRHNTNHQSINNASDNAANPFYKKIGFSMKKLGFFAKNKDSLPHK